MVVQRAHAHLQIILDGTRITGFADEDQPYEFTWPEIDEPMVGADGGSYGRAIADFGCVFMVRLSDISPGLQWFINLRRRHMEAIRNDSPIPIINGGQWTAPNTGGTA